MSKLSPRSIARTLAFVGFFAVLAGLCGLSGHASPAFRVPGGLVSRWKLDEGSGTSASDASGNGHTGTLNNGVAWTTGKGGQALSFDGTDDHVRVTRTTALEPSVITVSAWIKRNGSQASWANVLRKTWQNNTGPTWESYGFQLNPNGSGSDLLTFHTGYSGGIHGLTTPSGSIPDGVWTHVVGTYDPSAAAPQKKLYINGALVGSATETHAILYDTSSTGDFYMGQNGGNYEYYKGTLDEVRIYSRVVTADEVQGLAHDPALEARFRFEEGTGTTTSDVSGMGHDGTLQSGTAWTTGQTGNALSFDGTDDNVSCSLETGLPANNASQTVTWWLNYASAPSGVQAVVNLTNPTTGSAVQCGFRSGSVSVWNWGGTSLVTGTAPSANAWHHYAYAFDGTTHTLYIDGTSVNTSTTTAQTGTPSRLDLSLTPGWGEYYAGKLDEVRIYSRTLSSTEIAGMATGTGTGLTAVYYDNMDFTGSFVQQTDATVNFNWGTGAPTTGIGADTFSVLWTGQVQPQWSETYTFYTNTDDGVKLWVNGQLLVDFPQNQSATEHSGSITLSGGVKYDLRMEYFENGGDARAELRWSSGSTPKAIIPQSQLYPTDSITPALLNATSATGDLTHVYLRFNEPMHAATATTTGNYTLSGGLTVSNATISSDKKVVTLTASGNVTLGTTTVTASASVKNLEQEAIAQTTKTIFAGTADGIPDSILVGLLLTTDGNKSVIMFNEPSSHGVPQGLGETLRIDAPGTTATVVTLQQTKKLGGTGQVYFGDSGSEKSAVVTTSGGTPNVAYMTVRHAVTSSFEGDLVLKALVAGELRNKKDVTVIQLDLSTKYSYLADQTPFTVVGQITPPIQGVQFTNTTYLLDLGKSDGTTETTLFRSPALATSDASGQSPRTLVPNGVTSFVYDAISPTQPQAGSFTTTAAPPKMCGKTTTTPYCGSDQEQKSSEGLKSIKLTDGEKKLTEQDLVIRGRGFDYIFGRMYRSSVFQRALAAAGAAVVRDFGVGWSYSYADDYLIKDGTVAENSANYVIYRSNMEANVFVNIGSGTWSPGKSDYSQLRKNASNEFETRHPDGFLWTYHNFQTGTTPNKNGRLKSIEDRNGNRMTFFYELMDPDNTVSGDDKYVLAYVIDTLGREIRYQYYAKTAQTVNGRTVTVASTNGGALGRLARVVDWKDNMTFSASPSQAQDFSGQTRNRTVVFDYDSEGNLVKARLPIVTATPNGNDFSSGKTTRYRYYTNSQHPGFTQTQWDALTQAQRDRLLGKLTHIWYPNEVKDQVDTDPAESDAAETVGYETSTSSRFFGFATSYTVGGTNGNGVPSGGTYTYAYTDLNPGRGVSGSPYNYYQVQSLKTIATDRNGNQAEFVFSAEKALMSKKALPKGLRSGEPANYETLKVFNGNVLQRMDRLETRRTNPEGDLFDFFFNDATTDRFQQGNRIREIRTPGPRGADQSALETVTVYEPIFNQPWLTVSARGSNSSANGFTTPIADPASRTITDPYDATKTLNLRYAVVNYYDYQESTLASTAWSATSSWTPTSVDSQTVKATEVLLVRKLGLPDGNDTDRANSIRSVRSRLAANLVKLGLGDLNGDGVADPTAAGNVIRIAYGSPVLIANTNQHKLEADIETAGDLIDQTLNVVDGGTQEGSSGARLQTVVWMYQFNGFGQLTKLISPEGNVSTYAYFPENDPDGDTVITPTPADGRSLSSSTGGYLKETIRDATRSYAQQTSGTSLTGTVSNNKVNPATADLKDSLTYDDVGNVIAWTNGRGIRANYFANELDQVLQTIWASDVSGAASASPSDPLYNHSDTQQRLTAFAFQMRTFFDYNGAVVLFQSEDRGDTSSVDGSGLGSLPTQATATTPGLSSADASGGNAYVDRLVLYDRLNDPIEIRLEVDSSRSLNTKFRFDANQFIVLAIHPEGNADSWVRDERNLLFQATSGASSRPSAGKYSSGDPTTFNRPGGSGTTSSTITYNYDKNTNLIEVVDSQDNGGAKSSIAPTGSGAGDVTRFTYDGYNRRKTTTDPLENAKTIIYDHDSNPIRVIMNGDPVDDVAGSSENKTLAVTETVYDELSRPICSHLVVFQTPDVSPNRTPVLSDTAAMDSLAPYLPDASSDTASVPGATGITVICRVSRINEYDREGRPTFGIQDDLNVSRTDYDGAGRVVKTTDDALSNGFSSGAYDPAAISGNAVEMAYDDNGNLIELKETDVTTIANVPAEVFRTTSIYDSLDRLQTTFDNLGQATDTRYDSRGNAVAVADSAGPVSSRSLARRGLGSTSSVTVNSYGNVSRGSFDGISRLLETEQRLTSSGQGDGTNIGATLEGVQATAPTVDTAQAGDGLISIYYAYDDNSDLIAFRDDNGNTTAYIYDNQGRRKVERKGLGITGTAISISGGDSGAFNASLRGGVTPVDTESSGTEVAWTYDSDSNVTSRLDEAGNQFDCAFDALNRRRSCSITAASGFVGTRGSNCQVWKYDGLSRLTECFDGNDPNATSDDVLCTYAYDSLSRRVEETEKIGSLSVKATSFSYDLDCVCGAETKPNHTIYPDGRDVHTFYDALDRVLYRNDISGGTSYTNIGTYEYIGKSRVATLTYQNNIRLTHIGQISGQNADTGFDANRRIVSHRWESFTTQALGSGTLVMGFEHQDGNSTPASMYDRTNNKRIEYKTHDPSNSEQYKYDSGYRLTSTGSGNQGVDARAFERGTFTNANRTSMSGGVASYQDWDLEGLGNWARLDDNARVETRSHTDFNEIDTRTVAGNNSQLTHDKNGNTSDTGYTIVGGQNYPGGGLRMEWDALGRLRAVYKNNNTPGSTGDDVLVAEYLYDCHNRRVRKVVTNSGSLNGTTDFYYDGWRVVEERDGTDAITNQYTYGNYLDEVWTLDRRAGFTLANLNDNTGVARHFYLSNSLYHVYGLTNEGSSTTPGTLKEAYQYDAYGAQTVITDGNDADAIVNFNANDVRTVGGSSTINGSAYMFSGQRFDAETGLSHFKQRYYSSSLGRFLSRDPAGYDAAINLYCYVEGSVTAATDPMGLETLGELLGRTLKGFGGSGTKNLFRLPIPSIPLGPLTLNIDATLSLDAKRCCDTKTNTWWTYIEANGNLEGYASIGKSFKTIPKAVGTGRNARIKDPVSGKTMKAKKLEGKPQSSVPGYRERSGYITFGNAQDSSCPDEGLTITGYLFFRGTIGYGVAAQFNVFQNLDSNFDLIKGWNFEAGVAYGVFGASLEAGIGADFEYVFGKKDTGEPCKCLNPVATPGVKGGTPSVDPRSK